MAKAVDAGRITESVAKHISNRIIYAIKVLKIVYIVCKEVWQSKAVPVGFLLGEKTVDIMKSFTSPLTWTALNNV